MRAVVQRVATASVTVAGTTVGAIGPGLLVLLAVAHDDAPADADRMAYKIRHLRIFDGGVAAVDLAAPVLVVSQFTLYGDTRKGHRPSWSAAAPAATAEPLVDLVVRALRAAGTEVACGVFGAHMQVASVNDGPVTVLVET